MKKLIFILTIQLFAIAYIVAQADTTALKNAPVITFDKPVYDFGKIPLGVSSAFEFRFKNTGKEPLVINKVIPGCHCTSVDWPRQPVLPNQTGVIKVSVLIKVPGRFTKAATIYSNAKTPELSFKFFGTVEAPAPLPAPSENRSEKW
jgi:hypothetical protein